MSDAGVFTINNSNGISINSNNDISSSCINLSTLSTQNTTIILNKI